MRTGATMMAAFEVARADPDTMGTEIVKSSGVYGALGAATSAIEVGDRLWVSSTGSDRTGIFDLKP